MNGPVLSRFRWLWVLAVAGLLAACGQEQASTEDQGAAPPAEAPVDDEAAAGNVVVTYLNALAARDYATACAQLSPQAQEELLAAAQSAGFGGAGGCEEALGGVIGTQSDEQLAGLRDVPITAVEISGDTATVTLEGGTAPVPVSRAGDSWVISEFPQA